MIAQIRSVMNRLLRQQKILHRIRADGEVAIADLMQSLDSSSATLRRDLDELEKAGKLLRTHGGAVDPKRLSAEQDFPQKLARADAEKSRISQAVLESVPAGASVFVDAGTTCLKAGVQLLQRGGHQLITHSIPLLMAGCHFPGRVLGIGGEVRSVSRALVGGLATQWLTDLRFDYMLLGASAVDDAGILYTTEIQEAQIKSLAASRANHVYLLADSEKLTSRATLKFLTLDDCEAWFTDINMAAVNARKLSRKFSMAMHRC